jgi:hypothetical protein
MALLFGSVISFSYICIVLIINHLVMTKEQDVLHLDFENTNEQVETALLKVCTKNKKLTNFIKKFFAENKDQEICAYEDYGWEWDIESYGKGEGAEIAICNHDWRDDDCWEGDGWEMELVPSEFADYFHNFNWKDITLDNGKILLLIDRQDYLFFQIVDMEKLEDGKVDWHGLNW